MPSSFKKFAAKDFIPHRPPMLLIDYVGSMGGEPVAGTVVDEAWPMLENGILPTPALMEILAQGYGAIAGFCQKENGSSLQEELLGFLVGVKKFAAHSTVKAGDEILIKTEVVADIENFSVVEGKIFKGEELAASGQIKVFAAPRSQFQEGTEEKRP